MGGFDMANNVQTAMDWLADTSEGDQALKALSDAGEALRAKLPVKLTNAELKYLVERLWAQRAVGGWDTKQHFEIQTVSSDQQLELSRPLAASALTEPARVRNFGFIIKASIPQANF
jgi:hypothetical protein